MTDKKMTQLDFEKPLVDLYNKIEDLKQMAKSNDIDLSDEVKRMEDRAESLQEKIFANLTPDQIVKVARHPSRPTTLDYIELVFDDFVELKGDRVYGDDPAIVGGFATLGGVKLVIVGHQRGRDTKENIYRNFAMPQPEGYRKAIRIMKLAEKFNLPIVTLVDTMGAFPGLEAEERGQAEAIARNLYEMSGMSVPIVSVVTGEGGSGGALGIAVANEVLILENAIYSVISPEGCASILWRDAQKAADAAKALKITSKELKDMGIVDGIIPEPRGGAHKNPELVANTLKDVLLATIEKYKQLSPEKIRDQRFEKFRNFGFFNEDK